MSNRDSSSTVEPPLTPPSTTVGQPSQPPKPSVEPPLSIIVDQPSQQPSVEPPLSIIVDQPSQPPTTSVDPPLTSPSTTVGQFSQPPTTSVEPSLTPPSTTVGQPSQPPTTSVEPPVTPPSTTVCQPSQPSTQSDEPPLPPPSTTIDQTSQPPPTSIEPPLTPPSTTIGQPSQPPTPSDEKVDPEVSEAIKGAIALLELGGHDKAMNLIKESISSHPRSGQLHFAKGRMHLTLATQNEDETAKHLEDGLRSAQLATEFLPNSAHCARLLSDLRNELAVLYKELEFGSDLDIESPADDGRKDLFSYEDLYKESSFEVCKKRLEDIESLKEAVEEDRRKKLKAITKKLKDNNEDILKYKSFWSMTLRFPKKRGFRKVNIEELENHLKSLKNQLAVDIFMEAVDFAKKHKTWTFWECFDCVMKFSDSDSYSKHFWRVHWMGRRNRWRLDPDLWKESVSMIQKDVWRPVDTNEAIKLIVNPTKSEKGFDECTSSSVEEVPCPKWEFSDDIERKKLLWRIHRIFLLLRRNKCLPPVLIRWVLEYSKKQFERIIPLSQFKDLGLKRLQIVCLLGASQLTEVLEVVEDVAYTCGVSENFEINTSTDDDKLSDHHVLDIKERILFGGDFTSLLLDERVCRGKLNVTNYCDAVASDGSAISPAADECEDDVIPQKDDIVSWLYMGSNCGEGLESWTSLMESRKSQAQKSETVFLEKLSVLPKSCHEYDELSNKLRAIKRLEDLFLNEIGKEKSPENESQLYMDLLKKRQTELLQETEDISNRSELDAISEILERTEDVPSRDDLGNSIEIELWQLRMQLFKDLACHDAIGTRRVLALQNYVEEITTKTVCDYRLIIVPMLRSFLQSHLKDLFKDAQEKSKAAEEALLAEMALEAEKKMNKASADMDQKKKMKKKNNKKKMKKNKNPETSKESEATDDHIELHQKDEEHNDNPNSKNDDSLDDDDDERKREEARMLDEYVENQKRFEYEASLKASASGSGNEAADSSEK